MAPRNRKKKGARRGKGSKGTTKQRDSELYTLTEIGERTGISMSTLIRYKKQHQDKIPSVGKGRTQRFPKEAVQVFQDLYREGRKQGGRKPAARKRTRAARSAGAGELLTLAEIGRRTKISYPTLLRYVKRHGDKIPSVGRGRRRRFRPEAVEIFRALRRNRGKMPESGVVATGRAASARAATVTDQALARRIEKLEEAQLEVSRRLGEIIDLLRQPLHVTIEGQ